MGDSSPALNWIRFDTSRCLLAATAEVCLCISAHGSVEGDVSCVYGLRLSAPAGFIFPKRAPIGVPHSIRPHVAGEQMTQIPQRHRYASPVSSESSFLT